MIRSTLAVHSNWLGTSYRQIPCLNTTKANTTLRNQCVPSGTCSSNCKMNTFHYFNESYSTPIHSVCLNNKKLIGLIYQNNYMHSSPAFLIKLFKSLIMFFIWVPSLNSVNLHSLEATQKFAIRMCSHRWKANYQYLLKLYNLPTLSTNKFSSIFFTRSFIS